MVDPLVVMEDLSTDELRLRYRQVLGELNVTVQNRLLHVATGTSLNQRQVHAMWRRSSRVQTTTPDVLVDKQASGDKIVATVVQATSPARLLAVDVDTPDWHKSSRGGVGLAVAILVLLTVVAPRAL